MHSTVKQLPISGHRYCVKYFVTVTEAKLLVSLHNYRYKQNCIGYIAALQMYYKFVPVASLLLLTV
jgi:hypothetical protein